MNSPKPKRIIVANFKMNLKLKFELDHWLSNFKKAKEKTNFQKCQLVLCPPVLYLNNFVEAIKTEKVSIGAQNCFWQEQGAFTGEISPTMIHTLGGTHVILGHSERRHYLNETDEMVSAKILAALQARLKPILCVGETSVQKKSSQTMKVIINQLEKCLSQVGRGKIEDVIICYEPVWAISSNNPEMLPNANDIMSVRLIIKKWLTQVYGSNLAEKIKIIYGGSVSVKNVSEVCLEARMDGALVGNSSLSPYDLLKIVQIIEEG